MKIVINKCYGGFGVSDEAMRHMGLPVPPDRDGWLKDCNYLENDTFGIDSDNYQAYRTEPRLIKAVEELGSRVNSSYANLQVVEIPDGTNWAIEEYDGDEWVAEVHQVWS